ncbi:MAG: hypothetical protein A2381_07610 [Bdellovibrionales bacterium RIFOXYB1_FULL_37_110]|nr:MAG: hypothetical protein A2181_04375 [Bdellovibrionales bacterium RIFOXYA1_FULL_38_20]OFZ52473.1 MAG: hypothetical protein A2417_00330 [Bdellovibrionales bacterium RIFOXYC1_FULL_37_79]OFZ59675.1 MAG: hypothetical protein A2381_07610 [Bdellovibrionales bacterium RIFOXYB1_FULL_37_110]OFZ62602.1 MAG: hypothetical protein A2577_11930 [Bdellovibrionales bacterium RIFOXYD1_FULL_36_51]
MFEKNHLLCVYNYLKINMVYPEHERVGFSANAHYYYMLYLIDSSGPVEREIVSSHYYDQYKIPLNCGRRYIGPFKDLEELQGFAVKISEKINALKVFVLSAQNLSQYLDESTTLPDLVNKIITTGDSFENDETKDSKNSFFSKIFK